MALCFNTGLTITDANVIHPFVMVIILNPRIANSKSFQQPLQYQGSCFTILHFCLESEIRNHAETWKIISLHPHFLMEM